MENNQIGLFDTDQNIKSAVDLKQGLERDLQWVDPEEVQEDISLCDQEEVVFKEEKADNTFDFLKRDITESNQLCLLDIEPDWKSEWWDMPEFSMGDAKPQYQVTVSFLTAEDRIEFAKKLGITITPDTKSTWYPPQDRLAPGAFVYTGPKTDSKYPICIPSKGRYDVQTTGKALDKMGTSYKFFVEETEGDKYIKYLGRDKVVVMPFHDLGLGSIPARNFIWEWAKAKGYKRHWTVDDNIGAFRRAHLNRRLTVLGGGFFRAMENFVDRYENIAMAGPHHQGFVPDRDNRLTPFLLNSRIYSCILLDTSLPDRWRGRYNEDTDLSLRLLKQGYCTLLFRSLLMAKGATVGNKGGGAMKGGNTDNVYNTDDYRLKFAESLKEQHPDVVEVVWKFNRWHHQVDYSPFKDNKPIKKPGLVIPKQINNYGMVLTHIKSGKEMINGTAVNGISGDSLEYD